MGTVAYMSPEQAQGLPVDHRSDIFSLGILLYEMATGERPFRGNTNLSVLSSILKDTPRPGQRAARRRAAAARAHDPARAREAARGPLPVRERPAARPRGPQARRRHGRAAASATTAGPRSGLAAAAARAAAAGSLPGGGRAPRSWSWPRPRSSSARRAAARRGERRPALARRLLLRQPHRRPAARLAAHRASPTCWSRTSRSRPACACSSTARLYQLLDETRPPRRPRRSRPRSSSGVAQRAQATTALVGSFVRAGSQIRIQASLQDPTSGEVLASERVEGDAEERAVRARRRAHRPAARPARDAARRGWSIAGRGRRRSSRRSRPTSVEAYKAYAEGSRLHDRQQEREAQPYFEKAVAADPGFAMALAKLSVVHANLERHASKAREYAARALREGREPAPGERYYIEGRHYSLDPATDREGDRRLPEGGRRRPRPHVRAQQPGPAAARAAPLPRGARPPRGAAPARDDVPRHLHEPGRGLLGDGAGRTRPARRSRRTWPSTRTARPATRTSASSSCRRAGSTRRSRPSTARRPSTPTSGSRSRRGASSCTPCRTVAARREAAGEAAPAVATTRASAGRAARSLAIASLYRGDVGGGAAARGRRARSRGRSAERARRRAALPRAASRSELGRYREALAAGATARSTRPGVEPKLRRRGAGHARRVPHPPRAARPRRSRRRRRSSAGSRRSRTGRAEPARLHLRASSPSRAGDHAEARAAAREGRRRPAPMKTSRIDSRRVEIQYDLARAALGGGRRESARRALQRVVEAGPDRVSRADPVRAQPRPPRRRSRRRRATRREARAALRALPRLLEERPDRPRRDRARGPARWPRCAARLRPDAR